MPTMRNAALLFVVAALSLVECKPTMTPEQAHEQAKAHAINTVSAAMDKAYAQTGIPALFDHKKALGHMLNFKSTLYKHLAPVVSSLNPSSAKRDYESMVSWWCANKNKTALPGPSTLCPRRAVIQQAKSMSTKEKSGAKAAVAPPSAAERAKMVTEAKGMVAEWCKTTAGSASGICIHTTAIAGILEKGKKLFKKPSGTMRQRRRLMREEKREEKGEKEE